MLELRNITKTFSLGNGYKVEALSEVSLQVETGQFLTIVGSNGAGKSSLLKVVLGSVLPDQGEVLLNGEEITAWSIEARASFIAQCAQDPSASTIAEMTVAENLVLASFRGTAPKLRIRPSRKDKRIFSDYLAQFNLGIENRLDSPVASLSGGERQLLAMLMATFRPAQLLLLDEHTANLDPASARMVLQLTERLAREKGTTTLMVTHTMTDALKYGDSTIFMHRGRIWKDFSAEERAKLTAEGLAEVFSIMRNDKEFAVSILPDA